MAAYIPDRERWESEKTNRFKSVTSLNFRIYWGSQQMEGLPEGKTFNAQFGCVLLHLDRAEERSSAKEQRGS